MGIWEIEVLSHIILDFFVVLWNSVAHLRSSLYYMMLVLLAVVIVLSRSSFLHLLYKCVFPSLFLVINKLFTYSKVWWIGRCRNCISFANDQGVFLNWPSVSKSKKSVTSANYGPDHQTFYLLKKKGTRTSTEQ